MLIFQKIKRTCYTDDPIYMFCKFDMEFSSRSGDKGIIVHIGT